VVTCCGVCQPALEVLSAKDMSVSLELVGGLKHVTAQVDCI
jgi:hypothetical protein